MREVASIPTAEISDWPGGAACAGGEHEASPALLQCRSVSDETKKSAQLLFCFELACAIQRRVLRDGFVPDVEAKPVPIRFK